MKKIFNWLKAHLPTKRKLIQLYAALLFNANLKGYITGNIYKGPLKNLCTPGLNCYSCPGATFACPLGALQNSLSASGKTVPFYLFGIILLYGIIFGRWICGFLCPFGLIQELFHKIPTPKLKKNKFTRVLSYLKYVILVFFVFILPIAYAFRNFPLPGFCKYICPAGTLEGAMGLLANKVNSGYLRMLGPLFTWKFLLMISIILACVFIFRFFCRFICPLGALYGLFNKFSIVGVKVDKKSCTDCGLCVSKCKMDIKHIGDTECIQCGECMSACPTNAITWRGPKIMLPENEIPGHIDSDTAKKNKKRNIIVKSIVGVLMAALLVGVIVSSNLFTPESTVGIEVGNTCPDLVIDVVESDEKIDVQAELAKGKVVVLNFWYTTCGPCLEELPYFYEAAKEYGDAVSVIAIHIEQSWVKDVRGFIENDSGHPEWNDGTMQIGWDTGTKCENLFRIQACPVTVVISPSGIITDYFVGGVEKDELVASIENAIVKK